MISVDPVARTADVQGMCTYEDLVDATLPHGLIPLVVPQLRTITLGGAVTGLGIESTSFRNGLPHESVLEMDIFTGGGEVVTASPDNEHAELFATFPNSYGSLGYATRLRIELEPVRSHVALRHVRFSDTEALQDAIATITETGEWHGEHVDAMDGTGFEPGEYYLTLARWVDAPRADGSDYAGQQIYWRSIQQREIDLLTTYDYLWRWDTDWFWCSRAFGAQHPVVRRIWPRRLRRSDTYHRLVGLDRRFGDHGPARPPRRPTAARARRPGHRGARRAARGVPRLVRRRGRDAPGLAVPAASCATATPSWPSYPLKPGRTYVNVGFWGAVAVGEDAPNSPLNRAIEDKVAELDGHKSLYSESFYDLPTFDRLYDGANLAAVKKRYDPDDRLTSLYDKAVQRR